MEKKEGNREEKGGKNPQDQDKGRPGEKSRQHRDDKKGSKKNEPTRASGRET